MPRSSTRGKSPQGRRRRRRLCTGRGVRCVVCSPYTGRTARLGPLSWAASVGAAWCHQWGAGAGKSRRKLPARGGFRAVERGRGRSGQPVVSCTGRHRVSLREAVSQHATRVRGGRPPLTDVHTSRAAEAGGSAPVLPHRASGGGAGPPAVPWSGVCGGTGLALAAQPQPGRRALQAGARAGSGRALCRRGLARAAGRRAGSARPLPSGHSALSAQGQRWPPRPPLGRSAGHARGRPCRATSCVGASVGQHAPRAPSQTRGAVPRAAGLSVPVAASPGRACGGIGAC